jgi:3D (Asp-Asp-Asp) domain-containing protein
MPAFTTRVLPLALCVLAAGCSSTSRPLPKYEKPIARAPRQTVRTTAYTHSESDHIQHGRSTAAGGQLQCGNVNSAACDWSRWPLGTVFRVHQTGEIFEVDDYGWALAGTNTIDLYKPSRRAMNSWGVRRVDIEILQWGDVHRSLAILRPRTKYPHVKRMVNQIEDRYAELSRPLETAPPAPPVAAAEPSPSEPIAPAAPLAPSAPPVTTVAAMHVTEGGFRPAGSSRAPLKPFSADSSRALNP